MAIETGIGPNDLLTCPTRVYAAIEEEAVKRAKRRDKEERRARQQERTEQLRQTLGG